MADILVRSVPDSVIEALKRRAAEHRRSVQQEVVGILEAATGEPQSRAAADVAATIRARLAAGGRTFGDSIDLIRDDRSR